MQDLVIVGQMIPLLLKALILTLLISIYGYVQLISDPTHVLPASSLCIDLIFSDQPNLVVFILLLIPTVTTKLHTVILIL